jgi:protein-tyrosine kinase
MATNKSHLIERVAEELLRAGAAPHLASQASVPNEITPNGAAPTPNHPPRLADQSAALPLSVLVKAGLVEAGAGRQKVSEEFRLVQAQLVRAAFPPEGSDPGFTNLLMVTSARPGEGKTFTALNLASGLARQGDRAVLLLDADGKHGSLTDVLGLAERPGLLDLAVTPSEDPATLIHPTDLAMLSFLPIGGQRMERTDILASEQMARSLRAIGRRFPDRLIVIDLSPCLSASDPAALAPYVGQILFVIEAERTQREEVEASLDLIQACPSITLLLNKVRMSTPRSFATYAYAYTS